MSPDRVSLSLQKNNRLWVQGTTEEGLSTHKPRLGTEDSYPKQLLKSFSYRLLSVKRELEDLARQMQQPSKLLYIFGLWKPNICIEMHS